MPNRAKKIALGGLGNTQREGLYVIQGGGKNSRQSTLLIWGFLFLFICSVFMLIRYTIKEMENQELTDKRFFGLHEIYQQEGILRFQEEKKRLKSQVISTLQQQPSENEVNFATNVAVYLFPDVLPDSNFEKGIAKEQWGTFQEAIEKKPKTPESRVWFEELRANIWNYESPSRENPKISPFAKETIKIYEEISSP